MSRNFCILIPEKAFQIDKTLSEKLTQWAEDSVDDIFPNRTHLTPLKCPFTLTSFTRLISHGEIHADLSERLLGRYRVMDWAFISLQPKTIGSLARLLAEVYPHGKMGLLEFWLGSSRKLDPIRLVADNANLAQTLSRGLALNQLVLISLSSTS